VSSVSIFVSLALGTFFGSIGYFILTHRHNRLLKQTGKVTSIATGTLKQAGAVMPTKPSVNAVVWASMCLFLSFVCFRSKNVAFSWLGTLLILWPGMLVIRMVLENLKQKKRDAQIMAQWPEMLESMAIAALAGLDLKTAFQIGAKRTHGFLREELDKVVAMILGGMSLGDALKVLVKDNVLPARRLRTMLVRAEMLGTPIAEILNTLTLESYNLQKYQMEQKLNALPIKLSVITVLFLLPPVIIVTVVPHILAFIGNRW